MILVHGIRLPLNAAPGEACALAVKKAGFAPGQVAAARLHKVSVDARRGRPMLVYSVALVLQDEAGEAGCLPGLSRRLPGDVQVQVASPKAGVDGFVPGTAPLPGPVVVCGLGPAGLFAALELAEAGFAPTVLERGSAMDERRRAVLAFEQGGPLDENANIQFGEGGAGTFSDGKLTSRIKDPLCARVTAQLLAAGAPEEIGWQSRPHIGTDKLRDVFTTLRQRLESLGGRVLFDTKLLGVSRAAGRLAGVETTAGPMACGVLVLACGHSARDTFAMLRDADVEMEAKPFSVGVRAEHLQTAIDEGLYHEAAGHPALPPGEYQLNTRVGTRGVYTFCMCPGGSVVAAASENGGVVTNGMSLHARKGKNANAAVVVGVEPADFEGDPFKAIAFQHKLEQAAYAAGGGAYTAPAETLGSFLEGRGKLEPGRVQPSYPRGVAAADIGALLPQELAGALRAGFAAFGRKLPGYDAPDTVLTGLETRTSSPVRVKRGEDLQSVSLPGLMPCGEGAGYAGGIMSAAVDGLRVARRVAETYAPSNRT